MPTAPHIRTPVPTLTNSPANTRTGPSPAASATICHRKLRRRSPKLSTKSMVTDRRFVHLDPAARRRGKVLDDVFCACEKSMRRCSHVAERIWRPRRDLNPCYRRESRALIGLWRRVIGLLTDCDGQVLRSMKIMDPTLLSLLDSIPQKPPRSKLETHRELIRQLRRKGCTYRDIVRILRERVGLDVAVSTIHSFIKVRAKHRKQVQYELPPLEAESSVSTRMNPGDLASRIATSKQNQSGRKRNPNI